MRVVLIFIACLLTMACDPLSWVHGHADPTLYTPGERLAGPIAPLYLVHYRPAGTDIVPPGEIPPQAVVCLSNTDPKRMAALDYKFTGAEIFYYLYVYTIPGTCLPASWLIIPDGISFIWIKAENLPLPPCAVEVKSLTQNGITLELYW